MPHDTLTALLLSLAAGTMIVHAAVCAYTLAFPEDVATEIARPERSFQAWLFIYSLRVGRYDSESDLQAANAPQIIAANCRRRALIGLGTSAFALATIAFVAFGGIKLVAR